MGFRIAQLADLARQMQFTPTDKRALQIAAAEDLLLQLDPAKAYPFDFVLFRITGYHAKPLSKHNPVEREFTGQLLTGLALQNDLGLLIELVSDTLAVHVHMLSEPVLTIEQVCQQFNASDKSVQRWRRRGLAARRFIFPDGRKRVGFLAASVEKFFAVHRDRVARAANFLPVESAERARIVAAGRRLALSGSCRQEIFRRVGRLLDRSPLTIGHVLHEHDRENPHSAVLHLAAVALSYAQRTAIVRDFNAGATLAELSRQSARPRAAVYRVLLENRLDHLNRWKIKFIDDPLYHQPDAEKIVTEICAAGELPPQQRPEDRRLPKDLPPYIAALYRNPLLSPARERGLFLKLHLHKFRFVTLRRKLDEKEAGWRDLNRLESHLHSAIAVKNQIVAANLRLVVSVARKHLPAGQVAAELMELVSDGNVTLMRAADAFDIHRGYRFSTYATLALMKEFARASGLRQRRRPASLAAEMPDRRLSPVSDRLDERDQVDQLLSQLHERERMVLRAHYGLSDERGGAAATLEQVGRVLGISPQRMRQIERIAMAKLRGNSALTA